MTVIQEVEMHWDVHRQSGVSSCPSRFYAYINKRRSARTGAVAPLKVADGGVMVTDPHKADALQDSHLFLPWIMVNFHTSQGALVQVLWTLFASALRTFVKFCVKLHSNMVILLMASLLLCFDCCHLSWPGLYK